MTTSHTGFYKTHRNARLSRQTTGLRTRDTRELSPWVAFALCSLLSTSGWLLHTSIWTARPLWFLLAVLVFSSPLFFFNSALTLSTRTLAGMFIAPIALAFALGLYVLGCGLLLIACVAGLFVVARWTSAVQISRWLAMLAITSLTSLLVPLGTMVASWFVPHITLFDRILAPVLRLVTSSFYLPGHLLVDDGRSQYVFHFGIEELHIAWSVRFCVLAASMYVFSGGSVGVRWRTWLGLVGAYAIVVPIVWAVVAVMAWDITKHPAVMFDRRLAIGAEVIALVAACVLLKGFLSGRRRAPATSPNVASSPGSAPCSSLVAGLAFASVTCLTMFCTWYPYGERKATNNILVDDFHSEWERSDIPLDFSDEGLTKGAAYSYSSFVNVLDGLYGAEVNRDKPLHQCKLDKHAILLIKTPTRRFSSDEIAAIRGFVNRGGSLFVHGDHTNLFGMSEHLNDLLSDAGIQFNYDDQAMVHGSPSIYRRSSPMPHPTMRQVREIQFLTSCTLRPTNCLVEPVIVSTGIFAERLRYGRPGYFGDMAYGPGDRLGGFLQAAVVPYGKGRIAVFADSTVFSNFACFQSDYMPYALSTIEYLLHGDSTAREWLLGIGVTLATLLVLILLHRRDYWYVIACVSAGSAGMGAAILAAYVLNSFAPETPHPRSSVALICNNAFVRPPLSNAPNAADTSSFEFSGFLMALQRVQLAPRVYARPEQIPEDTKLIVALNPGVEMEAEDRRALARRVIERGATLLIVDSVANRKSTASELAAVFALNYEVRYRNTKVFDFAHAPDIRGGDGRFIDPVLAGISNELSNTLLPIKPRGAQTELDGVRPKLCPTGGAIYLVDNEADPVLVGKRIGKGIVLAFADGAALSSMQLGSASIYKPLTDYEKEHNRAMAPLLNLIKEMAYPSDTGDMSVTGTSPVASK